MKIEILGTRSKIEASAPKHRNHSGILIDDKILIDVGEKEFLQKDPEAIVFTHFHPDHAFFVIEDEKFDPEIPLFGPEAHPLVPKLKIIKGKFSISGYTFTPVPVIHALKLKSLGYLVEKDGKKAFLSGDVAWIEKAHLQTLPKLDLVVTEATFLNKGGRIHRKKNRIFGHTGVPDLVRIFSTYTDKIVFNHYGKWFFEDPDTASTKVSALETEGVKLILAHDGFIIEI